jgi:hypothetical protein
MHAFSVSAGGTLGGNLISELMGEEWVRNKVAGYARWVSMVAEKRRGWKRGFPERPWPLSNDAASLAFLLTASHMFNLAHDSLERQNLELRPLPRPHSPRKTK